MSTPPGCDLSLFPHQRLCPHEEHSRGTIRLDLRLSHQSPCVSVAVSEVSLAVLVRQRAGPAPGDSPASESPQGALCCPMSLRSARLQRQPHGGSTSSRGQVPASAGLGDIDSPSGRRLPLPKASGLCHVLFFLTIHTSSASNGGDTVCVLLSAQVPGTWAANCPRQAVTPQHSALGQKTFTPHTSGETPAGPGTCSERLVTRARLSWKR